MKLSVLERVLLGGMMAMYKGSFINLKLVRKGREAISFNDEENLKLSFVSLDGKVTWDPKASIEFQEVEIDLSQTIINIIKDMLQKLNAEEALTEQHFSLYEKFMLVYEPLKFVK